MSLLRAVSTHRCCKQLKPLVSYPTSTPAPIVTRSSILKRYSSSPLSQSLSTQRPNQRRYSQQGPHSPGLPEVEQLYEPSLKERVKTTIKETWTDKETNLKRREKIKQELKTSYWTDFKELNRTGGKLYEAAGRLLKEQRAQNFPHFNVTTLSESHKVDLVTRLIGKTSLVAVSFVQYGGKQVKTFSEPFLKEFKDVNGVQLIEVNVQENLAKAAILKLCLPQLRKQIPKERHEYYYTSFFRDLTTHKKTLGISNSYIGWVFLVDENCKVRWYAHGKATEKEVDSMKELTWILVDRMADRK